MRVCIPTTNDGGLGARVSPHFGKSPFFTLVDLELARARTITNPRAQFAGTRCVAADVLKGESVDAVVCQSIGPGARSTLHSRGIAVLLTDAWTVADAVRELRDGTLTRT